ncbi:MAG: CPXCG motif-containing cysteine-rich protein [Myxococcales bacterium]|nr:CPXCG motif-containing cysteine-rich protein [Myxococcales bacterium]MCB9583035.1 CPXCG motif-containing cysteine-rich protein [Polyangiaceae bacterium]
MTACPYCGEPVDTYPDPGGGGDQEYVEDCAVCCRPIRFVVHYDEAEGDYRVHAQREG